MIYHVQAGAAYGNGSEERPFGTITEAAAIARPGDTVLVQPGIYREYVDPAFGGTDDDHRITYLSTEPLGAVITGTEPITGWTRYQETVWTVRVPNRIFGDYNPYTTILKGDWYRSTEPFSTGEIYLNGMSMYEAFDMDTVLHPQVNLLAWNPGQSLYTWMSQQDGEDTVLYVNFRGADPNAERVEINVRRNCFYPSKEGRGYITFSGFKVWGAATTWAPPTAYQEGMVGPHWSKGWIIEDCEIFESKCSGISLGKYLQPGNDNKWTTGYLKDGTQNERDVICRAVIEGWTKENIGSHIIRRCHIHDCGQTGIVGHLGGAFSLIEDNHIHNINNKQDMTGAEIGGIKMHAAIDVVFRRNHIHHCTRGLWLDWQAQGTRVTQNLFHDNMPPKREVQSPKTEVGEDVFVEVSHGPTLIDNNVMLSACSMKLSTQGVALVHNLFAGSFTGVGEGVMNGGIRFATPRYTPYHVPHRTEVAGFMTFMSGDMRIYNNLFVQQEPRPDLEGFEAENHVKCTLECGSSCYSGYPTTKQYLAGFSEETSGDDSCRDPYYDHMPVTLNGNIYLSGAAPADGEPNKLVIPDKVDLQMREEDGAWYLDTNLYQVLADRLPDFETLMIDTEILGEAFEPEQRFEDPDGSPIIFNRDYFGTHRGITAVPGPFCEDCSGKRLN